MTGDSNKILKDGSRYDKYFESSEGKVTELPRARVKTTLNYMEQIVKKDSWQTRKISQVLKGATLLETARNIYEFLYNHIQYELDKEGIEQLRSPNRLWKDKKADCDCFALFISCCLTELKIKHSFRIAKYNGKDYYQHVYVILPNGIIIDPVIDRFNIEAPFTGKYDHKMSMRHQYLSGVPAGNKPTFGYEFDGILNGLGSVSNGSVLSAIRLHLENTRNTLLKEPSLVRDIVNPQTYINQINYVLSKNWNNPTEVYVAMEMVERQTDGLNGLNGFLSNAWNKTKKAVSTTVKKIGAGAKKVIKAVVSYNPLSLAMKGGLLLAFKTNLFGFTEKLKYGYYTESQARAMNLDINVYRQVRGALSQVEGMFEKLGGKKETLKNTILTGKKGSLQYPTSITPASTIPTTVTSVRATAINQPMQTMESPFNALSGGLGEIVTVTGVSAASGLLATIGTWLKKIPWDKLKKLAPVVKAGFNKAKQFVDSRKPTTSPYAPTSSTPAKTSTTRAAAPADTPPKSKGGGMMLPLIGVAALALLAMGSSSGSKKTTKKGLSGVPNYSV